MFTDQGTRRLIGLISAAAVTLVVAITAFVFSRPPSFVNDLRTQALLLRVDPRTTVTLNTRAGAVSLIDEVLIERETVIETRSDHEVAFKTAFTTGMFVITDAGIEESTGVLIPSAKLTEQRRRVFETRIPGGNPQPWRLLEWASMANGAAGLAQKLKDEAKKEKWLRDYWSLNLDPKRYGHVEDLRFELGAEYKLSLVEAEHGGESRILIRDEDYLVAAERRRDESFTIVTVCEPRNETQYRVWVEVIQPQ